VPPKVYKGKPGCSAAHPRERPATWASGNRTRIGRLGPVVQAAPIR
jgi:hypothetical protein